MTEESVPVVETAWLTLPDLVEVLGEPLGRIRRLLAMADKKARTDGIPDTESAVTSDLLDDA